MDEQPDRSPSRSAENHRVHACSARTDFSLTGMSTPTGTRIVCDRARAGNEGIFSARRVDAGLACRVQTRQASDVAL